MKFSSSEENYLKAIYHLQEGGGKVSTNALADTLRTKAASVTDMMKKLSRKKLLHYKPYYGFSLSNEGRKVALHVIRRHRLWEYFLSEKLGFNWNEVHLLAEELEHVSSKVLTDRLDAFLDYPGFDPHGDPIPNSMGKMKTVQKISVDQLPLRQSGEVCYIADQSEAILELLQHCNIELGTSLTVKKRFEFDGSQEIRIGKETLTISQELARSIFVKRK